MDKVRLALVLVTIAITVGPLLGIVLAYRDNLLGAVIPPESEQLRDIIENFFTNPGNQGNSIFPEPPGPEDIQYDPTSRTFNLTTKLKNPLPFDVTLNSVSGTLQCDAHNFAMGEMFLKDPVNMKKGETVTATITGQYTEAASAHLATEHSGEQSLAASLVDSTIDVGGIVVQASERISLGEIPNVS